MTPSKAFDYTELHQIRFNITYCSAGLMTMAVEGAKQVAEDEGLHVSAYELQDVHFLESLMIPPEEEGVEVLMQFKTLVRDASDTGLIVYAFVIDSLAPGQNEWHRNCTGKVLIHIRAHENANSGSDEDYVGCFKNITAACKHNSSPEAFYLELAEFGMGFGTTLQNLIRISSSNGAASCSIRVPDTAATMPENWEYPHAIHPALLESLTHVMIPALTGPKAALKETLVPNFVNSVYISSDIIAKPGDEIHSYATAKWHNSGLAEGDIVVLDSQKDQPLVIFTKMQYKALPTWDVGANEWQPSIETSTKYRKLCSQMRWNIDQGSFRMGETVNLQLYLECVFHKNPSVKILQLEGDPTGITSTLLRVATADGNHLPRFSSFVYTAASAKAIADAGIVLAKWSTHVQFEILNIEEDLTEQNFEPAAIDLVIADATLQTPGRMKHFLSQIRALMKPKGTLLIEGDATKLADIDSGISGFTSLNLGEDITHPVVIETWKTLMMDHDLASGPILRKDAMGREEGRTQLVVATAIGNDKVNSQTYGEALIVRPANAGQEWSTLMTHILGKLSAHGFSTTIVDIHTAVNRALETCLVVNMVEIEQPFLSSLGRPEFDAMKSLVLRSKSLLWITMGSTMTGECPDISMAIGFARAMRHENDSPYFATLDLGPVSRFHQATVPNEYADAVETVALLLCEEAAGPSFEREFAYQDGRLYVPRIDSLDAMNTWMNNPDGQLRPEKVCLEQIGCPIQVAWQTEGDVEGLFFKEDRATSGSIRDNQVQIDVKASALNVADWVCPTEEIGLECAGVITEVGSNVCHLRRGDKVMAIGPGHHRTTIRTSENLCQRIPDCLSFQQGASIPFAFCTAYLALVETAHLKRGESVLIHEGPDGIDQAAAAIALHVGADVFISTDSLAKRTFMIEKLHIAESRVLAADNLELPRRLMRLTKDKGIDVVIGYSQGEIMRQSWRCIAHFGRYISLHIRGRLQDTAELNMRPFKRSASYSSVDILDLLEHCPDEVSRIFRDVRCLLDQGVIDPISPITSYSYSSTSEGLKAARSGKMQGKIVLSAQNDDVVPVSQLCMHWLKIY